MTTENNQINKNTYNVIYNILEDIICFEEKKANVKDGVAYKELICLYKSKLKGAHLVRHDLSQLDLSQGMFRRADMRYANCENAIFDDADLSYANLSGANLKGASFKGARLLGANFQNTIFDEALNVNGGKDLRNLIDKCRKVNVEYKHEEDQLNLLKMALNIGKNIGPDYFSRKEKNFSRKYAADNELIQSIYRLMGGCEAFKDAPGDGMIFTGFTFSKERFIELLK